MQKLKLFFKSLRFQTIVEISFYLSAFTLLIAGEYRICVYVLWALLIMEQYKTHALKLAHKLHLNEVEKLFNESLDTIRKTISKDLSDLREKFGVK